MMPNPSDIGEGRKAAEPGEDLPADSGGHHSEYAVQRKGGKVSDNGSASVRRNLWCRLSYALSGLNEFVRLTQGLRPRL